MLRACMRVLLITPPMTQLNTPYPATAYLDRLPAPARGRAGGGGAGGLLDRAVPAALLARGAASRSRDRARSGPARRAAAPSASVATSWTTPTAYLALVDPVIRFLQGRDPSLALRIVGRDLPARGSALRRRSTATATERRPARLGLRRAGGHRPGAPPGQPVRRRSGRRDPRRHRPALRAVPLRREAGRQRGHLRSAGRGAGRRRRPWWTGCSTS